MSMTKRDFEAIARAINSNIPSAPAGSPRAESRYAAGRDIAYDVARHCETVNKQFDRARFLKACGLTEE